MSSILRRMAHLDSALLQSKFRGCLLGGLLGDCLGAPYEGDKISSGDKIIIQRYFDKLESPTLKGPYRQYTDDTAMVKSVAQTFIDKPGPEIDYTHMAKLFVKEYFDSPNRGYGQAVVTVFNKLRKNKFEDIFTPASEQFNGGGSFGNGGAMRIAPIALYFHSNYPLMIEAAKQSTRITHTHPLGVIGAVLQCIAIREALYLDPKDKIDKIGFINNIIEKIKVIEEEQDDEIGKQRPYCNKLGVIEELLEIPYDGDYDATIIGTLGNSISAYQSVPTAIFCFLKALDEIPGIKTDSVYRRSIQYAVSLGGDTDTIACMAGSIAGAYTGEESINKYMASQCEFHNEIVDIANNLYELSSKQMNQ